MKHWLWDISFTSQTLKGVSPKGQYRGKQMNVSFATKIRVKLRLNDWVSHSPTSFLFLINVDSYSDVLNSIFK